MHKSAFLVLDGLPVISACFNDASELYRSLDDIDAKERCLCEMRVFRLTIRKFYQFSYFVLNRDYDSFTIEFCGQC